MWVQYLSSFSVSQETIRRVKQGVALCAPCQSKKSLAWSVLCYCWLLIPDCSRGYRRGYWDRGARSFHQRMSDAGGVDRVWFLFYNRGEKNLRLDTYLSAYSCEISDVGKLLQKKKRYFPWILYLWDSKTRDCISGSLHFHWWTVSPGLFPSLFVHLSFIPLFYLHIPFTYLYIDSWICTFLFVCSLMNMSRQAKINK